jgi:hypothetical protein
VSAVGLYTSKYLLLLLPSAYSEKKRFSAGGKRKIHDPSSQVAKES